MILLKLLYTCVTHVTCDNSELEILIKHNKRLINENRYILLIRHKWKTVVNIILDNYVNLIKHMKFALIQSQMNIQTSRT